MVAYVMIMNNKPAAVDVICICYLMHFICTYSYVCVVYAVKVVSERFVWNRFDRYYNNIAKKCICTVYTTHIWKIVIQIHTTYNNNNICLSHRAHMHIGIYHNTLTCNALSSEFVCRYLTIPFFHCKSLLHTVCSVQKDNAKCIQIKIRYRIFPFPKIFFPIQT